ncbi:MAG TPA: GtrA family protein [Candidatus Onthousia faecipullorum]|uniref:GtrA family protein n=1 Tax=Candidatus Onthousia faecipullorum TaxID=2840887 RepID=A0A9D1GAZ8_9FIRM|nr:GtrA family protein [Candidatus Onthousia faecipullorum]
MLKKFHIKLSKKHENLLIQIFKFAIVGGIATVIDFVFLYIFREFCHFPILVSNTLSFCISVIYNYIASVKWVFDVNKEKDAKKQFIIFIVFSVIGLLLNDLIMWISVDFLSIYYLLAKIIATSIVMIFNFVTRKMFLE